MHSRYLHYLLTLITAAALLCTTGCAAIQHRNLEVKAKMSDTVFLDPETLSDGQIYVRVTNTSDNQEIDFGGLLKQKLAGMGRQLTNNPKQATYILQANLLYLGAEKQDYTYEGALAGGFGAGLTTAVLTRNSGFGTQALTSGAVGLAAAGIGALAGSMVSVDHWFGAVDVQIKEEVAGGVRGTMVTDARQGSATSLHTERTVRETRQEYRTRVGVQATQTNIDKPAATQAVADRLASQIAGFFR